MGASEATGIIARSAYCFRTFQARIGLPRHPHQGRNCCLQSRRMEAARVNSLLYAHATLTTNKLLAALPQAVDDALAKLLLTREIAS
jgi:hypothetical protein